MEESATLRVVGDEGQDPFQQPLSPHATKPSPRMPLPINQGPGAFILLEGIPTISGRDKGEISIHSLPHIPSPLSGPTPSILSREDDYGQSYRRSQSRDHGEGGEEDTFFDDRSLEHRIQRSLDHAPRPMYLDTPASVPVTPNGPLSVGSGLRKNKMALNSTQSKRRAAHASKMQNLVDDKQLSPRGSMVVLKLKQDVRNKDGELYLLRQGMNETKEQILQIQNCNDRLEERCEKAEARSGKLEKQSEAAGRALEEMKYELQARKDENQQIVAERNTMESEAKQLREQMDSLQSENREMSARIRSLLQEHRDDMKTFNETAESRIDRLKIELTSAHEEVDTLKNSLERVNNKNAELEKELEQGTGCRQAELSALSKQLEASRDEKINLEEAMQAADKESRRAVQDLETKEKEFKLGRESDHLEISRLRSTLNEAKKLNENSPAEIMIAEPGPSTEEPNELQKEKIEEFEKVNHQLAKDLAHLKLALDQSNAEKKTQLGEIRRLESALEEARKISSRQNLDVTFANGPSGAVVTPGCLKAHDESIADRLVRIRDAAERAALVKEHQREIARLKAQHQKACQALVTQHEQRLEDAVNEAKSTLNDKNDIAVESLKSDLEIRLATIEKRHREEVKRVRWASLLLFFTTYRSSPNNCANVA